MGPWVQRFIGTWTLLSSMWSSKNRKMGQVRLYGSLPNLLRAKSGFPFYGSLWPVLFIHPFVGPWVQGLIGTWTLLPSMWSPKNTKMGYVRLNGSLPKPLRPKGAFPFYGGLGPVLFIQPFVVLGSKVNWYMDRTSFDVIAQEHENGLRSTVWQPT